MMKIVKGSRLMFALFLVLALIGCNQAQHVNKPQEPATRLITDSAGREVEIPTNITRIAPSGPLAQIALYAVAPEKLIGWARKPAGGTEKYYDPAKLELPVFGMFYGDTFNLEALMKAKPDVIIDVGEAKKTIKEDMDEIQQTTGIPTLFIEAKLDRIPEAFQTLGDILSKQEEAKALSDYSKEAIEQANLVTSTVAENERVSLFYGIGKDGLNTNANGSFHAEIFDFVGLHNVAVLDQVSSKGGGNTVSMEQLLLWQPDVILFDTHEVYEKVISGDPLWKDLKAVQNGKIYEVPTLPQNWLGYPPSINRILGLKWLGHLFYPEQFTGDILKETQQFYRLFYHYELSDEEGKQLLSGSAFK